MPEVTVLGALKLTGLIDNLECYTSIQQLLRDFPKLFSVEVPSSITNVIVSNQQPTATQRDAVWFRRSNGGVFIGIYLFSEGTWRQFFPVPKTLYRLYGDSREPPFGYILASDSAALTSEQVAFLETQWHRDPTDTYWDIYDAIVAPI